MARYSSTFTAGAEGKIIGALLDAASMGKTEKARAMQGAEINQLDKDNLGLRKGEFFGQALKYMMTPKMFRRGSFQDQFSYPDYFARGQSTPFASPVGPFKANNAQIQERLIGNPFPHIATPHREHHIQPQTPLLSSGTKSYEPTGSKNKAPVKVKDEKLGVFFAAIAESLNRTVSSINQKQSNLETEISAAKESNLALAKGLEFSSDSIGDKLDAIADILNQQMALAKQQVDQAETTAVKRTLKKEDDLSGTERFTDIGEDPEKIRKDNEFENNLDVDNDELGDFGGVDVPNFEQGGIVSGPDSGYLVRLHGDEMITPLDNNYTQGQPSAVDGVTRKAQYESGTSSITPSAPLQMPSMNFFAKNPSERSGNVMKSPVKSLKRDKFTEEKLLDAMKLPLQVAGLGIMASTGNAVRGMPGFTGLKTSVKEITDPVATSFNEPSSISRRVNNLLETKTVQTERRNQETFKKEQSENRRSWWDIFGLFKGNNGTGGGYGGQVIGGYGVGGPGLSGAGSLQNLYHGTSNARAGSIFSGGFKPSNAMSWAGKGKSFLTPDFFDAAKYARPGATGLNPFSVKGLPGTGLNNMMNSRGQVLNILQPKNSGIRLPNWLRKLGLSPEVAVKPNKATKGLNLAQRLLGGKYPNSTAANMARQMMTSPATSKGMGLMSKLSPLLKGTAKVGSKALGIASFLTDFIFPDPTAQYDQMHGPNAYYNDPRYTGPKPDLTPPESSRERSAFVDMSSKEQSLKRLTKNQLNPEIINMNNNTNNENVTEGEGISHIDNVAETQVGDYQFVYSPYR